MINNLLNLLLAKIISVFSHKSFRWVTERVSINKWCANIIYNELLIYLLRIIYYSNWILAFINQCLICRNDIDIYYKI